MLFCISPTPPSHAYLCWTGLNKICSNRADVDCDIIEPANASDHNMQNVLPAVDIVIGSTKDIGNPL